jgi:hypothetical protein
MSWESWEKPNGVMRNLLTDAGKAPPVSLKTKQVYTYFIQNTANEYIKIGKSLDPYDRLADLQGANSDALVLLAYVPESVLSEKDAHQKFAKYRARGEWFFPHIELTIIIRRYQREFGEASQ